MSDGPTEWHIPTGDSPVPSGSADEIPAEIGNYRILRKLGEGGMGEVYEARQLRPVQRLVALKLLKLGMDSRQIVARFESERQALALMNHPNIASVLDAGSTDSGRLYFVMEYVPGVPIHRYCDEHRLDTKRRLELFIGVCEGVQHAHQKGILHRDIKPTNVLVTTRDGEPIPKIIDFGVLKATTAHLTDRPTETEVGQLVGTPEYMSPEQADMSPDIDTRADVYSLGALLYELLVGAKPFDSWSLRRSGIEELRRTIREEEPPSPSTRIDSLGQVSTSIAQMRATEVAHLSRSLRGDLDWITMKALEKDRARRYPSATELAGDLRRHLRNEPVLASPKSRVYLLRKMLRRHRAGVAFAAVLLLFLAGFALAMAIQARRVSIERDRASHEAATARQVSDFLVGLFELSDPDQARGDETTAREILDRGAETIRRDLVDQPLVQARLMLTIGQVYLGRGLYDQARPLLERSLEVRRAHLPPDHLDIAASLNGLANVMWKTGDTPGARPLYERALEIRERSLGPRHIDVAKSVNNLANVHFSERNYDAALPLYERALRIKEERLGPVHPDVATGLNNLAVLFKVTGRPDEALPLYRRALAIWEQTEGPDHPSVAMNLSNMAVLLKNAGRHQEALTHLERALAIREKVLGPDHSAVGTTLNNLGNLTKEMGHLSRAQRLFERSLAIKIHALGPQHRSVANAWYNLSCVAALEGRRADALEMLDRALDAGFPASAVRGDPDLASLEDDPSLTALLRGAGS